MNYVIINFRLEKNKYKRIINLSVGVALGRKEFFFVKVFNRKILIKFLSWNFLGDIFMQIFSEFFVLKLS